MPLSSAKPLSAYVSTVIILLYTKLEMSSSQKVGVKQTMTGLHLSTSNCSTFLGIIRGTSCSKLIPSTFGSWIGSNLENGLFKTKNRFWNQIRSSSCVVVQQIHFRGIGINLIPQKNLDFSDTRNVVNLGWISGVYDLNSMLTCQLNIQHVIDLHLCSG